MTTKSQVLLLLLWFAVYIHKKTNAKFQLEVNKNN